ncbi:hypothetical protein HK405_013388, partial [Cladochytrium tenue]
MPTLPKATDLVRLADLGVNGNLPQVPDFPATAQDPDARRATLDVGVTRGRARSAAVTATLPKNMDMAHLAASFGSQPAVAALGQSASTFRQVFDGMGLGQNEFLAYANYLVRLDDLIPKNQGGTKSIYSFSLDARTSSDGGNYDYKDLTAAFVDKYN